jgi:hypothetical protein
MSTATQQSQQQRVAIIDAWIASKYYPQTLLQTEHNTNVLRDAFQRIGDLSISTIVAAVAQLGDIQTGGKLEYVQITPQVIERVVTVEKVPEKSAQELRREKAARALAAGVDIQASEGRDTHGTPASTPKNEQKEAAVQAAALERAAQLQAKDMVYKMISDASPVYINGVLSRHRSEQKFLEYERKLVKRQIMTTVDGKTTFTQETDYVASIPVVADAINPEAKFIRNRWNQVV